MSKKLIVFILALLIFLVFIGLNLENRCNISFGFATLESVPVFFTAFASFGLGLVCAVPIALLSSRRKSRKEPGMIQENAKKRRRGRDSKDSMEDQAMPAGSNNQESSE